MSTVAQESANAQGRVTSIEVIGPTAGVHSFIDRYLQADAVGVAYNLDQLPDHSADFRVTPILW
jgi:hypothetical protein